MKTIAQEKKEITEQLIANEELDINQEQKIRDHIDFLQTDDLEEFTIDMESFIEGMIFLYGEQY